MKTDEKDFLRIMENAFKRYGDYEEAYQALKFVLCEVMVWSKSEVNIDEIATMKKVICGFTSKK